MANTISYSIDLGDLGEREFEIKYTYTPGGPGIFSGPPEKCSPPEASEYELLSIKFQGRLLTGPIEELVTDFLYASDDFHEELDERYAERKD